MRRFIPVTFIAILAVSTGAAAENWPQWRGPGGQGISTEAGIPTEWQPDRNILWKVPVPAGQLAVEELVLYRSHLGSGPARYEILASAPLGITLAGSRAVS